MQRRFIGAAHCRADTDDTACIVAPLRDPRPDHDGPPTLTGLVGRLPGGLRFRVVTLTGPRPSTRRGATEGPVPGLYPPPRVVAMLRTPFGSAMTPFGGDGPALAGTLGAGADPWNLHRVHVERDAAVAWEMAPAPVDHADLPATVTRLLTSLGWRLLRADVRGGDAASLTTRRGSEAHHARAITGTAALALRTSVLLSRCPPDVPDDAHRPVYDPALPGWVAAVCNRAIHGCDPPGGLWPVARTGLWRDGNNLACHSLGPRLRELREDAFTQAAELVIVVEAHGGTPEGARALADAIVGRWGDGATGHTRTRIIRGRFGPAYKPARGEAHPILTAILRHPLARLDCRRPSASLAARTRAFAEGEGYRDHPYAAIPPTEWPTFLGYDGPSGPAYLPCRADTAAVPFDPAGTPVVAPVGIACPLTIAAPSLAPEALDPTRPGAGTVVALTVQPFTYAVDHPDLAVRNRALDAALTVARRRNAARGVGARGDGGTVRPDSFKAFTADIDAALLTPVLHVRAVPRTPGVARAIVVDLGAAFRGLAAWARDQHRAHVAGETPAGIAHLTRCLSAFDAKVVYTPHKVGRGMPAHIGKRAPVEARGRIRWDGMAKPDTARVEPHPAEASAALYATEALLRAGAVFDRFGLPTVTVEWRAAVGVPDGLPTVSVWLPVPARALAATPGAESPVPGIGEALALVWHALTVGPGLVWGPEAHGAALAAFAAPLSPAAWGEAPDGIPGFDLAAVQGTPSPEGGPATPDPVALAHALTMADLRHRVALGHAHVSDPLVAPEGGPYRLGAPALVLSEAAKLDRPDATAALCGYADPGDLLGPAMWGRLSGVADPFRPDLLRPPSPGSGVTYTGGRVADREARLAVVRAALWPLAPGSAPRRVQDGVVFAPPPLPTLVAPGVGAEALGARARVAVGRPIREALYLMGYLRPAAWRSVETVLPGVVPSPWEGPLAVPETVPDARAVPSEGREARLARDGAMRAEGEAPRTNRLGDNVARFLDAAVDPAWRPHPDLRTVDPARLVPPLPRPGKGTVPTASRAAARAAAKALDAAYEGTATDTSTTSHRKDTP